ncbi:hypothetical protein HERIO_143 [Hepatospora eriocheir]|uniref:Spindle pole body component n=1 Tax=Hepatospora eriocheir TaxID=1081669 RepID=A0A1X0QE16_9MICR|nr:hypothetical protein HERIO_143 [Hepatospora eriocheir]
MPEINNFNNQLKKLAGTLLYPKTTSKKLLERIDKVYFNSYRESKPIDVSSLLENPLLYKSLLSDTSKKLVNLFLELKSSADYLSLIRNNLKKIALGFDFTFKINNNLFTVSNIRQIKPHIDIQYYNILLNIYQYSLIYKNLKYEMNNPISVTHKNYLSKCKEIVLLYEQTVMNTDNDFIKFYCEMYEIYVKLSHINKIHNSIKNKQIVSECTDIIYEVHNQCTSTYISTGVINDRYNEYFISSCIEYNKIPSQVSKELVNTIFYIGKNINLLKNLNSFKESNFNIKLNDTSASLILVKALKHVNEQLYREFIVRHKIYELYDFIKSIFLFRRVDFIEFIFEGFKRNRNLSKKNCLGIIEEGLYDTFFNGNTDYPENFINFIDLIIDDVTPSELNVYLEEPFSLICKLNYPITLIFNESFISKLVSIFKFLWKIKKIEALTLRLGTHKYMLFIYKIQNYIFYECIKDSLFEWENSELVLNQLTEQINSDLSSLIKNLYFQNGFFERIFYEIEYALIKLGTGGQFDETKIKDCSLKFIENLEKDSSNKSLILDYIRMLI